MLYMFTILVAIMDSVLASGQPFIGCLMQKYNAKDRLQNVWKKWKMAWKNKGEPHSQCSPPQYTVTKRILSSMFAQLQFLIIFCSVENSKHL